VANHERNYSLVPTKLEVSSLYDADRPPHTSVLNSILVLSFHRVLGLRSGLQCWAYLLQFCTC